MSLEDAFDRLEAAIDALIDRVRSAEAAPGKDSTPEGSGDPPPPVRRRASKPKSKPVPDQLDLFKP
jgi:hypothetical protein